MATHVSALSRSLGVVLVAGLLGTLAAPRPACAAASAKIADRDGDGVADDLDRCPERPGPLANLGCPDRDEDNDGIIDREDACPSIKGPAANHGCPGEAAPDPPAPPQGQGQGKPNGPQGEELAQLRDRRLQWPEPVSFEAGKDTLTPKGLALVESAARVLSAHAELHHVLIEGHVDEPGNTAARAKELSRRRAEMVKQALIQQGVAAERLRTQGFGYSRLLDRSETPEAARINNRIEIVVID